MAATRGGAGGCPGPGQRAAARRAAPRLRAERAQRALSGGRRAQPGALRAPPGGADPARRAPAGPPGAGRGARSSSSGRQQQSQQSWPRRSGGDGQRSQGWNGGQRGERWSGGRTMTARSLPARHRGEPRGFAAQRRPDDRRQLRPSGAAQPGALRAARPRGPARRPRRDWNRRRPRRPLERQSRQPPQQLEPQLAQRQPLRLAALPLFEPQPVPLGRLLLALSRLQLQPAVDRPLPRFALLFEPLLAERSVPVPPAAGALRHPVGPLL